VLRFIRLLAALSVVAVGCRSKDAPAPAASATLAEAPAPATLLAELSLGNPKETWQRLRLLGGAAAQALPSSLPVLLATSLSFPPAVAGSLDETLPMVGAALSREGASEPDLVLGMHVTSGAELVASLTLGDGAKFRRVELGPRLLRLVAAPGVQEFNGALGVSGNYLLVATRVEALKDAGRFVAEGIAKRAATEPGLVLRTNERVLKGSLSRLLREGWQARRAALVAGAEQQRKAKGRAPDFADPEVVLGGVDNTVEALLGVLESSRQLDLSLVPEADRLRAELSLVPGTEGAASLLASEIVTGPIAPLWQLPQSTRAALLLRGDEQPKPGAPGLAESVTRLFGARLTSEQAAALSQAFEALAQSHRGATVVGLLGAPEPALLIRCEVTDPIAFTNAVTGVLRLLELGPVSSWLSSTTGKPSLELVKSKLANMGQARLRFKRQREGAVVPLPSSLSVTWEAKDGVGYVVVSPSAAFDWAPFNEPVRLGASAWLQKSQPQLAAQTALGVYLDARLLAPGGPDDAPLLIALGKREGRIVLAVDLAPAALHAVSRLFALDR
jgi:hypothetical protein